MPLFEDAFGPNGELTLKMHYRYATALFQSPDNLTEAVKIFEDATRRCRRVFGDAHPLTTAMQGGLEKARSAVEACASRTS